MTQSLSLLWRANLFSLGHHGFYGLGAYIGVVFIQLIPETVTARHNPLHGTAILIVSIIVATLCTACLGALLGHLFQRIRGDYFAVATLIVAEILRNIESNCSFIGGSLGFEVQYLVFDNSTAERMKYVVFFVALISAMNLLFYVFVQRLDRSIYGVFIKAIRDDTLAAELSGVDVVKFQTILFSLCCGVAGAAGVAFLHYTTFVAPSDFSFLSGIAVVLGVILGRFERRRSILAAIVIYFVYEVIKLRFFGLLGLAGGDFVEAWKDAFLGLFLIAAMTGPPLWESLRDWFRPESRPLPSPIKES